MAAFIFNVAKGKVAQYAALADAHANNEVFTWILLKSAGLEADSVLKDYDTVAAILAAANDEADFAGYARIEHTTTIAVTVNDTTDVVSVDDTTDPSWSPTEAQSLGKIICAYDPTDQSGTDTELIPLFADDVVTTTGTSGTFTYNIASGGFYTAS